MVTVDLSALGGSALTDAIDVPKDREDEQIGEGVPVAYVPARNTVFLAVALGWAEVLGATDLFVGVNAVDYSVRTAGPSSCGPSKPGGLATAAGTEGGKLHRARSPDGTLQGGHRAPRGEARVDLGLTHTCYDPVDHDGEVLCCGRCDAVLRLAGFREAGVETHTLRGGGTR